jgi:hypothetical protein
LGVGMFMTMAVLGHQSGCEGEDQRGIGELHDRVGPREAQLRETPEDAPIIERRCVMLRNGASWQSEVFHHFYEDRAMDRLDALRQMTRIYREHMHSNEPVHNWPTV